MWCKSPIVHCAVVCLALGCGGSDNGDDGGTGSSDTSSDTGTGNSGTASGGSGSGGTGSSEGPDGGSGDTSDDGTGGTGTATGGVDCDDLPASITADGIVRHLEALQEIADANDGNRAMAQPGYDESAQYVLDQLEAAGYGAFFQDFTVSMWHEVAPTVFEQVSPEATTYVAEVDFSPMLGSGDGDVTAQVTAVDLDLGPGNSSTSGCENSDYAGFPSGNVALVQRGECTFNSKVERAQENGAAAVLLFNQGNTADREGLLTGISLWNADIPALSIPYDLGVSLNDAIGAGGLTVHIEVDGVWEDEPTSNVIAETTGGSDDEVVMLGAHLDSVLAGPGINDNGSGSAGILEVAIQLAACQPHTRIRFGWWAAEEIGLHGSRHYVEQLSESERDAIQAYLNFDMIGSVNYVRFRYDGDASGGGDPPPAGSAEIEQLFVDYFDDLGLPTDETGLGGGSDFVPFRDAGIAVGGVSSGWGQIKTEDQEDAYGGTAGEPLDPCYHQACDRLDGNIDTEILEQLGKAMAHAVQVYGLD
jgi:Zn-dependent M28 family amino/carboxypeptidase